MPKEHGKATIVLLLGTSSAGKGTIIKELKAQDAKVPAEAQMNWHEDGLDLVMRRRGLLALHNEILASDSKSELIANQLAEACGSRRMIMSSIFLGRVDPGFLPALTKETSAVPSSVRMKQMQNLIDLFHQEFVEAEKKAHNTDELMEELFELAVEKSRNGIPTILDLVPMGDYDVVSKFNEYMSAHKFSCPAIFAVAHCGVKDIVAHMDKRNAEGDPDEIRDGFFPFKQYGEMYRAIRKNDSSKRVVGTLTTQDILDAVMKYGDDKSDTSTVVLLENNKDAQGLVKKLGIVEGTPIEEEVAITTDMVYDALFQTETERGKSGNAATVEIAKQINAFATRTSSLPKSSSPTAKLITQNQTMNLLTTLNTNTPKPTPLIIKNTIRKLFQMSQHKANELLSLPMQKREYSKCKKGTLYLPDDVVENLHKILQSTKGNEKLLSAFEEELKTITDELERGIGTGKVIDHEDEFIAKCFNNAKDKIQPIMEKLSEMKEDVVKNTSEISLQMSGF